MYFALELAGSPSAHIVGAKGIFILSILVQHMSASSSRNPCIKDSALRRGRNATPTLCIVHSLWRSSLLALCGALPTVSRVCHAMTHSAPKGNVNSGAQTPTTICRRQKTLSLPHPNERSPCAYTQQSRATQRTEQRKVTNALLTPNVALIIVEAHGVLFHDRCEVKIKDWRKGSTADQLSQHLQESDPPGARLLQHKLAEDPEAVRLRQIFHACFGIQRTRQNHLREREL